jgi:hypothetical protein
MTKLKAFLIVSFILTLAAGVALGLLLANLPIDHRGPSRLEAELKLNLTDTQRKQMDAIWEEVVGAKMRQWGEQRDAKRQEREKALNALLTDDLRPKYDAVFTEFSKKETEQRDALRQEREKAIAAVFAGDQRVKYEAIQTEAARDEAAMAEQRKLAFEEAAKRTREILTPEQAVKYDDWIQKQRDRGFGPPRGGRRGPPPEGPGEPRGGDHGPPPPPSEKPNAP